MTGIKKMFASVLDEFIHSKEIIFQYLILNKDMKNWYPPQKGIYSIKNNFVNERLENIEILCDLGKKKATVFMEVSHYEPCKEVRFYSDKAVYEDGQLVRQGNFFPFEHMEFRTTFRESSGGCQVIQDVYIKPQGLIGWIICKFIILPKAKRELKSGAIAIKRYLKSLPIEKL